MGEEGIPILPKFSMVNGKIHRGKAKNTEIKWQSVSQKNISNGNFRAF